MGEGVLRAVARAVGTPVYVYDAKAIRQAYHTLSAALRPTPHRICYSVKANSSLAVLDLFRQLGAGADIVSGGELSRALRVGFAPADIVFGGVGKTAEELTAAVRARVGLVNVESFDELCLLDEIASRDGTRVRVGIRVNPDVATETHPYTRTGELGMKFGAPLAEAPAAARWTAGRSGLELVSVGMHIGSQVLDVARYCEGARRLAQLVAELRGMGITTLEEVDVGGGLGIRYTSEEPVTPAAFAAAVRPLAEETGLPLIVEPGRHLVGNAGVLLARCLYRKASGGKTFVVVDAGMSELLRPSLYAAAHEVRVVETAEGAEGAGVVEVVGPLCESGDFLAREVPLAGAHPGALLAVYGAGAYGFVMSSNYNSRPRPAEVLVDDERWAVVRDRETVADLMRGERTLGECLWPTCLTGS